MKTPERVCTSRIPPLYSPFAPKSFFVKVNFHAKNQGHKSNGLAVRVLTHTHTHRNMAPILLPRPLTREVKTVIPFQCRGI